MSSNSKEVYILLYLEFEYRKSHTIKGLLDHFNELMESPCTNHAYLVNTSTRTTSSSSAFCDRPVGQRKEKARRQQPRKGVWWARIQRIEGPYMATEII